MFFVLKAFAWWFRSKQACPFMLLYFIRSNFISHCSFDYLFLDGLCYVADDVMKS